MRMTGRDPLHMPWMVFQGIMDRLEKLRRWESGEGQSIEDRLREKLAENE